MSAFRPTRSSSSPAPAARRRHEAMVSASPRALRKVARDTLLEPRRYERRSRHVLAMVGATDVEWLRQGERRRPDTERPPRRLRPDSWPSPSWAAHLSSLPQSSVL